MNIVVIVALVIATGCNLASLWFKWRRPRASVPKYVDACELLDWTRRYAYDDLLPEHTRKPYRHMIDQIGRMEWYR